MSALVSYSAPRITYNTTHNTTVKPTVKPAVNVTVNITENKRGFVYEGKRAA